MHLAKLQYLFILLILAIFGVLGNYLNLPLFFGVDFIFGSIAVLMAVRMLGLAGAITVALIAGSYTYFIWGHPYAMIIFTAEAIAVGLLWQRKISSLALADILFWLIAGIPLVWLFYNGVMNMEQTPTLMIGLKQAVNGVANAIIATYLLLLIPPKYTLQNSNAAEGKLHLNELFFTTLLGIPLIFSFVIVSFENKSIKENLETGLIEQLSLYYEHIEHENYIHDLDAVHDDRLRHNNKFHIMIFTESNSFIDSTLHFDRELDFIRKGTIKKVNGRLSVWLPERNNMPLMLWWKKAYYFIEQPLSGKQKGTVYVLNDTQSIIKKIQENILATFELLLALIIIGGIAAYYISQGLTSTIVKLTSATKNLPEKLRNKNKVEWPESNITELLQLSRQAEIMSNNISSTFDEVNLQANMILESSIDSIITTDENGMVLGFNRAAEGLFGYFKDEIIGQNIKILLSSQHKENHDNYLNKYNLADRLPLSGKRVEVEGQHKGGSLIPVELSVTKMVLNDKTTFTGILTDISERKINEQLKRDFISTVSHELRTPLTSINGSVKLIQAQKDSLTSEQSTELLDTASRNIDRLSTLINDLLDFEKLESSGLEYKKVKTNIKELIFTVVEQTTPLLQQNKIELKENINQDCDLLIDPQRLSQVLVNFVSNAIKFSGKNKTIEIGCYCENDEAKIYVKDDGEGVVEEFKEHIFERFTQADSSDARKIQRGTGLGLAISKRMTEDMGGKIGFVSLKGQGSTFFVIFPLVQ